MPFTSPGDLPNPGIEPRSLALQADSLPAEPPGKPKNTGMGADDARGWQCPFVFWASLVAQLVKNLPAMWETWV